MSQTPADKIRSVIAGHKSDDIYLSDESISVLLAYCRCFYFGEG
jgi:hypothetical protein